MMNSKSPRKGLTHKLLGGVEKLIQNYDPINKWSAFSKERIAEPAFQRDQDFIQQLLPFMEAFNTYFGSEIRGFNLIPKDKPVLLVGNHSGGVMTPDTCKLLSTWFQERKDQTLIGLAFDAAFSIPGLAPIMRKIGQVPASHANALKALENGCSVLVYPGGAHEVFRPWSDRNQIDFAEHRGFIRLAIKAGVAIVPVVSHGGHNTTMVLSRGEKLAKLFKMDRLRMTVYPILLQFPWGISTPGQPGIPMPAKITMQVLEPRDMSHHSQEDAQDEELVNKYYEEITQAMQETLDALVQENPRPIVSRIQNLVESVFYKSERKSNAPAETTHKIYQADLSTRSVRNGPAETHSYSEDKPSTPFAAAG